MSSGRALSRGLRMRSTCWSRDVAKSSRQLFGRDAMLPHPEPKRCLEREAGLRTHENAISDGARLRDGFAPVDAIGNQFLEAIPRVFKRLGHVSAVGDGRVPVRKLDQDAAAISTRKHPGLDWIGETHPRSLQILAAQAEVREVSHATCPVRDRRASLAGRACARSRIAPSSAHPCHGSRSHRTPHRVFAQAGASV